jgi:hypothetical protein
MAKRPGATSDNGFIFKTINKNVNVNVKEKEKNPASRFGGQH